LNLSLFLPIFSSKTRNTITILARCARSGTSMPTTRRDLPLAGMLHRLADGTLQPYGQSPPSTARSLALLEFDNTFFSPVIKWCCFRLVSVPASISIHPCYYPLTFTASCIIFHRLRIVVLCHLVHHHRHVHADCSCTLSPPLVNSILPLGAATHNQQQVTEIQFSAPLLLSKPFHRKGTLVVWLLSSTLRILSADKARRICLS